MANGQRATEATAGELSAAGEPGMPRIVFLHYTAPPVVGGVEAVIAEQVRLFSQAGYATLVVAGRGVEQSESASGETVIIPEIDSEDARNLEMQALLEKGDLPAGFIDLRSTIEMKLGRVLLPTDVVLAHNMLTTHFNLAFTAAVHRMLDVKRIGHLIVWCHDISRHVNPARQAPQWSGEPWDLLRAHRADVTYVAVSEQRQRTLADILQCGPQAIQVIPNGVDPAQLLGLSALSLHMAETFGLFQAEIVILMPVRVTRVKNIEYAIRVVDQLKRSGRVVRMIVTGPPDPHVSDIADYHSDLKQMRDELGLGDEVVFAYDGTKDHPSPLNLDVAVVNELYRLADIVLMPSIREGFGMPVLEAGMVDRPVFATAMPVVEVLPDFDYLIRPDEHPESVARRIAQWAASDASHRLRVRVRRDFTWGAIFSRQIQPLVDSLTALKQESNT